jgi:hypothetical protein
MCASSVRMWRRGPGLAHPHSPPPPPPPPAPCPHSQHRRHHHLHSPPPPHRPLPCLSRSPSLQTLEFALGCLGRVQPSSTLSEKAMRKLPRWVQSRTRLGRHLARQDIAEITRTIRASRAEAGPRIVHTIDSVQVVPPPSLASLCESASAHILSGLPVRHA